MNKVKKVAILTSGGDAPGMNNAIRAAAKRAQALGIEPYFVLNGYKGLVADEIFEVDFKRIDKWTREGGTNIYSARLPEFKELEIRKKAVANLNKRKIDSLVVVGGDGSFIGALKLTEMGINCIGIPGTIDNDIASTKRTIGFETALNNAVIAIDQIRDTMDSHNRVCIVEIMGRYCPDLAVFSALATGAEICITSDNVMTIDEIVSDVQEALSNGKRSVIIACSEMIYGTNGLPTYQEILDAIQKATNMTAKLDVLGYIQRGGRAIAIERVVATRMGMYAIELLAEGQKGRVIGIDGDKLQNLSIKEALKFKRVNRKSLIEKANNLNIK